MRFYRITEKFKPKKNIYSLPDLFNTIEDKDIREDAIKEFICKGTSEFRLRNEESKDRIFCCNITPLTLIAGINSEEVDVNQLVSDYINSCQIPLPEFESVEITLEEYIDEHCDARSENLIDDNLINPNCGTTRTHGMMRRRLKYEDRIANDDKTFDELLSDADEFNLPASYKEELLRIKQSKDTDKFVGHPAHYLIMSDNYQHRRMMVRGIISALYLKKRLLSRRYTILPLDQTVNAMPLIDNIYDIDKGATILLKSEPERQEDDFRDNNISYDDICSTIKNNSFKTLTIISIDSCSTEVKDNFIEQLGGLALVTFTEDTYCRESAVAVLEGLNKQNDYDLSPELVASVLHSDKVYTYNDLFDMYNNWQHRYLNTTLFPEYQSFVLSCKTEDDIAQTDAYKELQEMIGLTSAKRIISNAINYFKLQHEYKIRGIKFDRPAMHMVFTGNPGTAKTTVARLVARILKDNNILSVGKLFEVGRSDLVGKYVGHTAPLVKSRFEQARGSVLFIDEAYSLVDDRAGLYGDEAINTIVQEMENHRDETIVIFAGYKQEMENFVNRNPGLSSRIAFKVDFDDYDENELLQIAHHLAKKIGFTIDKDAEPRLLEVFAKARVNSAFGNGRYVRNLLDKAKLNLANRLVNCDMSLVSDRDLTNLTAEDFVVEETQSTAQRMHLGFGE